jgi:hypothetical protein
LKLVLLCTVLGTGRHLQRRGPDSLYSKDLTLLFTNYQQEVSSET